MYLRIVVVSLVLGIAPRIARASWTYSWYVTGDACIGNELGREGHPTFETQDECESSRANNPVNAMATQSGCLANVDSSCTEGDGSQASSSPHGRRTPGILRFFGGPSLMAVSAFKPIPAEVGDGVVGGIELARGVYPGHPISPFIDIFGGSTTIVDPKTNTKSSIDQGGLVFGAEAMLGKRGTTMIFQLGLGGVGSKYQNASDWFGVKGEAGLDLTIGARTGLLLYVIGLATPSTPGTISAGLALELRSWWLVNERS